MPDTQPFDGTLLPVDVEDQIIVGFDQKASSDDREKALKQLGDLKAEVLKNFAVSNPDNSATFAISIISLAKSEVTLLTLQQRLIDKDKRFSGIAFFERNARVKLAVFNDPWYVQKQQWALDTVGVTGPWVGPSQPPGMPNPAKTIVAIVDSGLRRGSGGVHADLGLVEPGGGIDMEGHGTKLAGTIGAVSNNAIGIASPVDPHWNISLLSVQFFNPMVPPNAANGAMAIIYANFVGAKVINASWHVAPGGGGVLALQMAISFAVLGLLGHKSLVVMAAGNDGTNNENYPTYPASLGGQPAFQGKVLTVLATDRHDEKAFFSNYGPNTVNLGAPGLRVLTTDRYLVNPPRYSEYSGTSAAAALVSAAAGLVFALNPGWTPQQVVQRLIAKADVVPGLKLACIGGKRLNIDRAVNEP